MEITIKGNPEEIAALAVALREQPNLTECGDKKINLDILLDGKSIDKAMDRTKEILERFDVSCAAREMRLKEREAKNQRQTVDFAHDTP